jgi:hypothetical protein
VGVDFLPKTDKLIISNFLDQVSLREGFETEVELIIYIVAVQNLENGGGKVCVCVCVWVYRVYGESA